MSSADLSKKIFGNDPAKEAKKHFVGTPFRPRATVRITDQRNPGMVAEFDVPLPPSGPAGTAEWAEAVGQFGAAIARLGLIVPAVLPLPEPAPEEMTA